MASPVLVHGIKVLHLRSAAKVQAATKIQNTTIQTTRRHIQQICNLDMIKVWELQVFSVSRCEMIAYVALTEKKYLSSFIVSGEGVVGTGWSWLRWRGACEYGNELSGSIKCGEFID